MSGDYALTSFSSGLWFIKSLMFCKVVEAMFASASRVKKAWVRSDDDIIEGQ